MNTCKNCQNTFSGRYCNECGEKVFAEADLSVGTLLFQALGAITNLDSKVIRTAKLMFQNPGILAQEICSGVRVPYLKPFQIFVICNLFFFIFLADTDLFRTPAKWFFNQEFEVLGTKVMDKTAQIMEEKALSLEEVKLEYDRISSNLSKALLLLLIPCIASLGIVIDRKAPFGKHLVFATLYFAQVLLVTTLLYLLATSFPLPN